METVGAERDGWTKAKAEAELRERLVRVERKGYRRPERMTFGPYARTWLEQAEKRRGWKPSTRTTRRRQVRRLGERFEAQALGAIKPRHVAEYVDERLSEGDMPATIGGDLDVFFEVMKAAKREELIDSNPVDGVERPKIQRRKWRILEPVEVARVRKAFTEQQPRVVFLTLVLTGIRRFELQGLRWRDIDLVENRPARRRLEVRGGRSLDRALTGARRGAVAVAARDEVPGRRRARLLQPGHRRRVPTRSTSPRRSGRRSRRRHRGLRSPVPRSATHGDHERRRRRVERDRGDGEGGALLDGDDEAVPAPGRCRLPRRGRGARTAAARGRKFYPPERI